MSDDIINHRCKIIREINENKREFLYENGFLESMTEIDLETIEDYDHEIEKIIISYIEKIGLLIDQKIEKILDEIGSTRLEKIGMFSDTMLLLHALHMSVREISKAEKEKLK